jgi:hypothetical protein
MKQQSWPQGRLSQTDADDVFVPVVLFGLFCLIGLTLELYVSSAYAPTFTELASMSVFP